MTALRLYIFIFIFSIHFSSAQKNHFNLELGFGPSYFFNDGSLKRYIDHTMMIGVNYVLDVKNQKIAFNPGLNIKKNAYHAKMHGSNLVHVNQTTLNLNLEVLLQLTRKIFLGVGISLSGVTHNNVFITRSDLNGRQYYGYGNEQMVKNYFPTDFQAGIISGLCFPFKIRDREHRFDIKIFQSGSRLVNADYYLDKAVAGEDIKVLSTKALPTQLIFCWEINLQKIKKGKKENAEE